jgi:hypothetical protein
MSTIYRINANPQGVATYFIFLCDAIASWTTPTEELKFMFHRVSAVSALHCQNHTIVAITYGFISIFDF